MTLQPNYSLEDCKNHIMSAKEEISGELVPVAQCMVRGYESRLEMCKTEIDEYKEKLRKSKIALIVAVIPVAGTILVTVLNALNNKSATEAGNYIITENKFLAAIEDVQSKKGQELIKAIGTIEIHKDEVFNTNHKRQWPAIVAIAKAIKNNSKVSSNKYGSLEKSEIQRLVNILKFRNTAFDASGRKKEDSDIVDLSKTYLYGIDLSKAQLPRTSFNKSILEHSTITDADLTGSFFTGTSLKNANMSRSNLTKASLNKFGDSTTNLIGVDLTGTDLKDADLRGAKLFHPNPESRSIAIGKIKKARNLNRAKFDQKISNILDQ